MAVVQETVGQADISSLLPPNTPSPTAAELLTVCFRVLAVCGTGFFVGGSKKTPTNIKMEVEIVGPLLPSAATCTTGTATHTRDAVLSSHLLIFWVLQATAAGW